MYKLKPKDSSWIERLWQWADDNNISGEILPRNKHKLLSLDILDLENDGEYFLKDIPDEIGMLSSLNTLILCVNGEEVHLPNSIANLTQITELYLCGNVSYTSIELMLNSYVNLRTLYIDNNQVLKALPENLCDCACITKLVLINNKNLLLTQKQFKWAIKLRDDEKGYEKIYTFSKPDGSFDSYTTDYGQKFQYYCFIPFSYK